MNIQPEVNKTIQEISSLTSGQGDYTNFYKINQSIINRDLLRLYDGQVFSALKYYSLAAGASQTFLVKSPSSATQVHTIVSATGTVEFEGVVYEGATASGNGTSVTSFNRNRNSTNTANLLIYDTPTGVSTSGALVVRHARLGSGKTSGGEDRSSTELILKYNTTYYLTVTNQSNQTGYFTSQIDWYEIPN